MGHFTVKYRDHMTAILCTFLFRMTWSSPLSPRSGKPAFTTQPPVEEFRPSTNQVVRPTSSVLTTTQSPPKTAPSSGRPPDPLDRILDSVNIQPPKLTSLLLKPDKLDIKIVKELCQKVPGNCKMVKDTAEKTKDILKEMLSQPRGNGRFRGKTGEEIDDYFDTVLQAKKVILASKGLLDVITPDDNGLWAGDQIPTLDFLRRVINGSNISNPFNISLSRSKRASGISLDYYTGNRWPSTMVNFYIDPWTFSNQEANTIRAAINSVQSGTCLNFVETLQTPYIEFLKTPYATSSSTCGWANLGYTGDVNDAVLNFGSSKCQPTIQGTIVHEILHILGVSHEHNRYDRDNYVEMDWSNIDPQSYDIYSHDDAYDYNPYCVAYDYLSVMHYSPYVAVVDTSRPAFTTKYYPEYYLPRMGKANNPTWTDLEWVNRIYCVPSTCRDATPYCGWSACADCQTYGDVCPNSCNKC